MPPNPNQTADEPQNEVDSSVMPTEAAELKITIEDKHSMWVKVPGNQAGLIVTIVLVLAVTLAPPVLFWAASVTLSPVQALALALAQLAALVIIVVTTHRRRRRRRT